MKYDIDSGELIISCRELVSTARRGIPGPLPYDIDEPKMQSDTGEVIYIEHRFAIDDYTFRLTAPLSERKEDSISIKIPVDSSPKKPRKEVVTEARGEGYISAYALMKQNGYSSVNIEYVYTNNDTGEKNAVAERIGAKKLEAFFEKCKMSIKVYAKPEIERVTERLPSMKGLKFPYGKPRAGQGDFVRAVYKSIARGGRLFATAPTGTGKTVSVLYPALKAMGAGKCDKVFYFTPKTTTAKAASECLIDLAENGANVRAIILSAKDKTCEHRQRCKDGRELCENSKNNKLPDAALYLYNTGATVITKKEVCEVARQYKICPYELALSYSELCDVIICDVNYLFDPSVYIRRFFNEGGRYAFLIDEAHNLPDRAREIYSAEITEEELISPFLDGIFGEHSAIKEATRIASEEFFNILTPYVKEELYRDEDGNMAGATHLSDAPTELYGIFDKLMPFIEDEIFKNRMAKDSEKNARHKELLNYYYRVKKFRDALLAFDSSYELFIFSKNNKVRAKIFAIDPAREIAKRLEKGCSAVFFSGTLTPLYYYRSLLGGEGGAEELEIESPFDPSQLSVSIMDRISTRSSEREDTLLAVCRAIAAAVSAKRGNYMIFSPSFAYSEALYKIFKAKYPKIKTVIQKRDMSAREKEDFLKEFEKEDNSYLIAFCVMGGIYSEGIDLAGEKLIGAVIVGIGMPSLSYEREAIAAYYNEKYEEGQQFAYIYPGINRVLQAAGRVIRREDDKGVIVLIDDRFDDPIYKTVIPKLWSDMKFISSANELRATIDEFWQKVDEEK